MAIRQITTWLSLLVIISFIFKTKGDDDTPVKEIIRNQISICVDGFNNGDFEAYFSIFDQNAQIINDLDDIKNGRDGVQALYNKVKKIGKTLSLDHIEIKVIGNYAEVTDDYDVFPGKGKTTGKGRAMVLWKKIQDDWKIIKILLHTQSLRG